METNLAPSFRLMTSLDELESILDKFTQKNDQQQQQQQHFGYTPNNFSDKING